MTDAFDIFLILCGAAALVLVVTIALLAFYQLAESAGRVKERERMREREAIKQQIEVTATPEWLRDMDV